MDLSFSSFDRATELVAWPGDLAALMVGVATRQGASVTAMAQAALTEPGGARPGRGRASFNPAVAALLMPLTRCERDVHQNGSVDLQPRPIRPCHRHTIGDGSPAQEDR